jgi:hypothetical protein
MNARCIGGTVERKDPSNVHFDIGKDDPAVFAHGQ